MPLTPNRRWLRPRCSLATLFLVVTVLSVWLAVQVKWIRDRHAVLRLDDDRIVFYFPLEERIQAPGLLWLFGEEGVHQLQISGTDDFLERAAALFPEAEIQPTNSIDLYDINGELYYDNMDGDLVHAVDSYSD